tara:strand:+ start:5932 stop:6411 length:480 start_codon:yes stop_codon:yes gene_type:complete
MTLTRIRTWFILSFFVGASINSQSFEGWQALSIKPPVSLLLETGRDVELVLTLNIKPGYHINSNQPEEDYLIPTSLNWQSPSLPLKSINYPIGELVTYSFSSEPLSVYSGKVQVVSTFHVPETLQKKPGALLGSLLYQACNNTACFPPKTISVTVPLVH